MHISKTKHAIQLKFSTWSLPNEYQVISKIQDNQRYSPKVGGFWKAPIVHVQWATVHNIECAHYCYNLRLYNTLELKQALATNFCSEMHKLCYSTVTFICGIKYGVEYGEIKKEKKC